MSLLSTLYINTIQEHIECNDIHTEAQKLQSNQHSTLYIYNLEPENLNSISNLV